MEFNQKGSRSANRRFMGNTMKPRNPFHDAAIMRKGHVHDTKGRQRQVERRQIEEAIGVWLSKRTESKAGKQTGKMACLQMIP